MGMNLNIEIKKNIGIFGGAFNPIHIGHINIALSALNKENIDEIWFLPSFRPPHKDFNKIVDFKYRFEMVDLAIKNIVNFKNLDLEKKLYDENKIDITNTYAVLKNIKNIYKNYNFYLIIGLDSLYQIDTWVNFEDLIKENKFIVADRKLIKKNDISKYNIDYKILNNETINISSTEIRENIHNKNFLSKYLNKDVIKYIKDNKLYV